MYKTKIPDRDYTIDESNHVTWETLVQPFDLDAKLRQGSDGNVIIFDSEFRLEAVRGKVRHPLQPPKADVTD